MTDTKLPRQNLRDKVDALISWYEKFKPEGGKRIEVNCSRRQLVKEFAGWDAKRLRDVKPNERPSEVHFRGRVLFTHAPQ